MTGRIPEQRGGHEAPGGAQTEHASTPFLTVAEVAERMRVSRMTVYRLVHGGELPAVRFGRSFRVPPEAVDDLIESARYTGQ